MSYEVFHFYRYKKHTAAKDLTTKTSAELKSIFGHAHVGRPVDGSDSDGSSGKKQKKRKKSSKKEKS